MNIILTGILKDFKLATSTALEKYQDIGDINYIKIAINGLHTADEIKDQEFKNYVKGMIDELNKLIE